MRIRFHPGAVSDLASSGDWYEFQVPGLGGNLASEVDRALDVIQESPMSWPLWPDVGEAFGVHRFLLARFPFAIGYIIQADDVVVLAIAHLRRRPGYWLVRLAGKR